MATSGSLLVPRTTAQEYDSRFTHQCVELSSGAATMALGVPEGAVLNAVNGATGAEGGIDGGGVGVALGRGEDVAVGALVSVAEAVEFGVALGVKDGAEVEVGETVEAVGTVVTGALLPHAPYASNST